MFGEIDPIPGNSVSVKYRTVTPQIRYVFILHPLSLFGLFNEIKMLVSIGSESGVWQNCSSHDQLMLSTSGVHQECPAPSRDRIFIDCRWKSHINGEPQSPGRVIDKRPSQSQCLQKGNLEPVRGIVVKPTLKKVWTLCLCWDCICPRYVSNPTSRTSWNSLSDS